MVYTFSYWLPGYLFLLVLSCVLKKEIKETFCPFASYGLLGGQ